MILYAPHGGGPPERLQRIRTRINANEEEHPKIARRTSNWKPSPKRQRSHEGNASSEFLEKPAWTYAIEPFDPVFAVFQHEHSPIFQDFEDPARVPTRFAATGRRATFHEVSGASRPNPRREYFQKPASSRHQNFPFQSYFRSRSVGLRGRTWVAWGWLGNPLRVRR